MSSALALAAVTAVLRESIRDAFVDHGVSSLVPGAAVTAVAPDRVDLDGTPGVNVYLYLTTPNAGWRNVGLPSRGGDGARLTNPPLALDLHYMLTAYGTEDFHADVLLGVAVQRLHEVPVLARDTIRSILADGSILSGRLADSGLADQVELVKLSPEPLGSEQLSKLWTSFSTSYRPSAAYLATVVLVEAEAAVRRPLPVLTRGPVDPGTGGERGVVAVSSPVPPFPTLEALEPPGAQPAVRLGEDLRLRGHHLDGAGHVVVFRHTRLDVERRRAPSAVGAGELTVAVPGGGRRGWPAGVWAVHVELTREGRPARTNTLPLALAPAIVPASLRVTRPAGRTRIALSLEPFPHEGQPVSLVVGDREASAAPFTGVRRRHVFVFEPPLAAGAHVLRVRVGGVESVFIDRAASPPTFDPTQEVVVP